LFTFGAPLPIKLKRSFSSVTCWLRFGDNCSRARLFSLIADDIALEDESKEESGGRGVERIESTKCAVPGSRGGDDKKNAEGGDCASDAGSCVAETAAIVEKYLTEAARRILITVMANSQFDPLFVPISRKNRPLEDANASASAADTARVIPSKEAIII